jgi:hypothetical protein
MFLTLNVVTMIFGFRKKCVVIIYIAPLLETVKPPGRLIGIFR